MTALILGILSNQAALITELVKSQTPAEQAQLWQRYIDLTEPLHKLLMKIEGLGPAPAPAPAAKV